MHSIVEIISAFAGFAPVLGTALCAFVAIASLRSRSDVLPILAAIIAGGLLFQAAIRDAQAQDPLAAAISAVASDIARTARQTEIVNNVPVKFSARLNGSVLAVTIGPRL